MEANAKKYKPFGFAVMIAANLFIICIVNRETTFWGRVL